MWSPQGGELFYRDSSGAMMAVPIETTPALALGIPTLLFEGQYFLETGRVYAERHYDADPSGDRFLMVTSAADPAPPPINVVLNWVDELEERVPGQLTLGLVGSQAGPAVEGLPARRVREVRGA